MKSDFLVIRALLECVYKHLNGSDETSLKMREAVDLLIEAAITADHSRKPADVLFFPRNNQLRP